MICLRYALPLNEKHPSHDILAAKQADLWPLKRQDLLCFATTKRRLATQIILKEERKIRYSWKHQHRRRKKKRGILHLLFVYVCVACCINNKRNRKLLTKTGHYFFFATFCLNSPSKYPLFDALRIP